MSDDEDYTDRTLIEAGRQAIRGKIGERGADRRKSDRLTLKDWIAYAIIVAGPVAAVLWATQQSVTKLEVEVEQVKRDLDKGEAARAALWNRVGNHLEGHGQ